MNIRLLNGCIVVCLVMWAAQAATGQSGTRTLAGRVTDAATGKPIPFANVYINASTKGTIANDEGQYRLVNLPSSSVDIVASAVGYVANRQLINLARSRPSELTISLTPDSQALSAVTVKAPHSTVYSRQYRLFKRELLGDTPFADKCQIMNQASVLLAEKNGHLQARVTEPLVIENRALGYRIIYELTRFDTFRGVTYYAGTSLFQDLTPENPGQAERWRWNRQLAYRGSFRHLLASVVAGTYEQEGYQVYQADFVIPADPSIPLTQFVRKQPGGFKPDSLIKPAELATERFLTSDKPLEIFYTRRRSSSSPYRDIPYAYSLLILPRNRALITTEGWVVQPLGLEIRGEMSSDRIGNLLPADWRPASTDVPLASRSIVEGVVVPSDPRLDSLTRQAVERQQAMEPAVFLQLDKDEYTTGDHLWFSGFVVDPQTFQPILSRFNANNETLQLELIAPTGQFIDHQWLAISEGRVVSDLHLSDTLATGTYKLRAYTSADNSLRPAFERTVSIVSGLSGTTPAKAAPILEQADSVDLQVLPEGGHWVAGIPAKLGIKVVNQQGKGQAVQGELLGKDGTALIEFSTNAFGIGRVELTPRIGERYQARIKGRLLTFRLPAVDPQGLTLSVDPVSDSSLIDIRVRASPDFANHPIYVTLQIRGQLVQKTKLKLQQSRARLALPTNGLPAGLANVTLFDSVGMPRAERLVYIPDRQDNVQAELTANKRHYEARESMQLDLRLTTSSGEPVSMLGSASVVDADQLVPDSAMATIRTHLLLTGDLRGTVQEPNSYVKDNALPTRIALDNLLLTQGWRRLNWQVSTDSAVYSQGMFLSGLAVDRKNRPLPQANILLRFANQAGVLLARTAQTDANGQFSLDGLVFPDTVQVRIRLMNQSFKPLMGTVILAPVGKRFSQVDSGVQLAAGPSDAIKTMAQTRQAAMPGLYREAGSHWLKEVPVLTLQKDETTTRRASFQDQADATVRFTDNGKSYSNAYEMLAGKVPGVQVQRQTSAEFQGPGGYSITIPDGSSPGSSSQPLYLLDGTYLAENREGNTLLMIDPPEVERIEVIKNFGTRMDSTLGGRSIVAFYSKNWTSVAKQATLKANEVERTLYGYAGQREFYTPRYEPAVPYSGPPVDRRDVLYWKPLIATDSQGQSTLRFSLSDVTHSIRLTVQGVTMTGQPVYIETIVHVK